jgi:hypothetical protein
MRPRLEAVADLAFDEARHEYSVAGRRLPSVTQILSILQDFGGVPAEVLARAAEFGSHVHQAVDLYNKRTLDEASLDPALAPYLADWQKFLADSGAQVTASELRLCHPTLHFAGTLDVAALMGRKSVLIDVKTGVVPRTVGPQLAAYAELFRVNGGRVDRRLCVQLTGDGYRVTECKDPADWSVFMSCLNVLRFKNAA